MTDQDIDSMLYDILFVLRCTYTRFQMEISMFMNLLRGESGGECDVINYVATILLSEEVPNYCWVENSRQYKMTD